jgi:uncharacterized membrane protein YedE/YeeE
MKQKIGAFLGGAVFGIGLAIAGMTQPAKIVGFFDFSSRWDPSLAFVMLGALLVYAPGYAWVTRRWRRPLWAPVFTLPTRKDIDWRLLSGSLLFGIGWGLSGYCPGPALTSVGARSSQALITGSAILVGVGVYQLIMRVQSPPSTASQTEAMTDG